MLSRELSDDERTVLKELYNNGAVSRTEYDREVVSELIRRVFVRPLYPDKIGITTMGQEALFPDQLAPQDKENPRISEGTRHKSEFIPLSDSARSILAALAENGGEMDADMIDGRAAYWMERKGLVIRAERRVKLTDAGRKRVPRPGELTDADPDAAIKSKAAPKPFLKPNEATSAAPEPVKALATPQQMQRMMTEIAIALPVQPIPLGSALSDDQLKAQVLDMLMQQSPSVRAVYESVVAMRAAADKLSGV